MLTKSPRGCHSEPNLTKYTILLDVAYIKQNPEQFTIIFRQSKLFWI